MTKYVTCKMDMSEVPEWHCDNNCEDCVYYEFNKKGGVREQVYEEMERIRNHGRRSSTKDIEAIKRNYDCPDDRKYTMHITRNSNRRRNS